MLVIYMVNDCHATLRWTATRDDDGVEWTRHLGSKDEMNAISANWNIGKYRQPTFCPRPCTNCELHQHVPEKSNAKLANEKFYLIKTIAFI